jgi:hypothetical protein
LRCLPLWITDVVGKQYLRVDVTEEFPFLVTKLSPYYDQRSMIDGARK